MRVVALMVSGLLGGTGLAGAVPGVPAPPRPGPLPTSWGNWANDAFGGEVGENPDDFRTNAFGLGFGLGDWIVAANLSSLTDKREGLNLTPSRSDELTLSVGRVLVNHQDQDSHTTAMVGVGMRYADDLGGSTIQNEWHEVIDFPEVDLPYDDRELAATAWVSGQYIWLSDTEAPFGECVFCDGSRIGIAFDLSALGSSAGELQGSAGTSFVWTGHDGVVWTGIRGEFRGSETMTDTAETVAEREQGTWFQYGISVGAWYFEGAVHLDNNLSTGRLGWMLDRAPLHNRLGRDVFTVELGGTVGEYGLGAQALWQPRWLERFSPLGRRSRLFMDYRFGRVPEDLPDASVRYQQGLLGWDLSLFPLRDGLHVNPFIYTGVGWRFEEVNHEGPRPTLRESGEDGAVAQAGAGVRMTWGDRPHRGRGVQYGASLTYDRWIGLDQQELVSPVPGNDDTFTLLDDNESVSLRMMIAVGW